LKDGAAAESLPRQPEGEKQAETGEGETALQHHGEDGRSARDRERASLMLISRSRRAAVSAITLYVPMAARTGCPG